jgi:Uncharacterised nucleotidyltransferase
VSAPRGEHPLADRRSAVSASSPPDRSADTLRANAPSLSVNVAGAEVVAALGEAGIQTILLKGASLQRLLYDDGSPRPYGDLDLLVAPDRWHAATDVIQGLGFGHVFTETAETGVPGHAGLWTREEDGVSVDLHWRLLGVEVTPAEAWRVLSASTETMTLAGIDVEVLSPPANALHVALHAAQHGPQSGRPIADLERAVERLDDPTWRAASTLARELQAEEMLAAGLRLVQPGEAVAARLGLPPHRSVETALRWSSAPSVSLGIQKLARTPGLRRKAALLGRELVPSPEFIRAWWPPARRGGWRLLVGYLWHPVWLLTQALPAWRAWRRAVRELRDPRSASRP